MSTPSAPRRGKDPTTAITRSRRGHAALLPVVEVFGPTIQGEGPRAGIPAFFVRFGGCDFRCTWCDSLHAVQPAEVRLAPRLSELEVLAALRSLPDGPRLVVLTGGNPALLELGALIDGLHEAGYDVAVETQGSVWRDWLAQADELVVSPKPPSSGMVSRKHSLALDRFLRRLHVAASATIALKVVIFNGDDLDFAETISARAPTLPLLLSAGTDVGLPESDTLDLLRERFRWLCEAVACRASLSHARVLPQLQVVAWGTARGV